MSYHSDLALQKAEQYEKEGNKVMSDKFLKIAERYDEVANKKEEEQNENHN